LLRCGVVLDDEQRVEQRLPAAQPRFALDLDEIELGVGFAFDVTRMNRAQPIAQRCACIDVDAGGNRRDQRADHRVDARQFDHAPRRGHADYRRGFGAVAPEHERPRSLKDGCERHLARTGGLDEAPRCGFVEIADNYRRSLRLRRKSFLFEGKRGTRRARSELLPPVAPVGVERQSTAPVHQVAELRCDRRRRFAAGHERFVAAQQVGPNQL
jgi:hypothetical protein